MKLLEMANLKEDKMIIINVHSMVDVITNSSTELFVLDTEKSLDWIKDILQEAINLHNKINNTKYKFEDIFREPYIGSAVEALKGYEAYYQPRNKKGVIIEGAGDNSIPFWMMDFIEDTFGYSTERFHLG